MAHMKHWKDLPKIPFHHGTATRQVFSGDNVMMVFNTIQPEFPPFLHSHPHEQLLYIMEGHCEVTLGDEVVAMGPGDVIHIPCGMQHDLKVIGDETVLNMDIFTPIREDFLQ